MDINESAVTRAYGEGAITTKEGVMKSLRKVLIASLSAAVLATATAHAASTTDYSDQWWARNESGWGAAVVQQASTMFVNLMVYGADGKPTWFVAASSLQANSPTGHTVFLGDLYATTGPYYGGTFNPALVSERKVGTLTFDATSAGNATMSYTVDGTPVVKNVTRQTWGHENLTGSYFGGWNSDKSGCITAPLNAPPVHYEEPLTITIDHAADNAVMMVLWFGDGSSIALRGTYSQSGKMGRIVGEFDQSYSTWSYGSIDMVEIETTISGFTARFSGDLIMAQWRDWCDMTNGRIGGVRR